MQTTLTTGFRETILEAIKAAKVEVARIANIISDLESLLGEKSSTRQPIERASAKPVTKARSRSGRRTPEQVTKQAQEMLAFVRKAGDAGASGKELNDRFGKVVGTIRDFVEHRTGEKLKTKGQRSAMRYYAA